MLSHVGNSLICVINVLTNRNFSWSSYCEAPTFLTLPLWGIQLPQMTSTLCVLTTLIKKARSSLVSANLTCAQLPHISACIYGSFVKRTVQKRS